MNNLKATYKKNRDTNIQSILFKLYILCLEFYIRLFFFNRKSS